jgi:hypothetical protein
VEAEACWKRLNYRSGGNRVEKFVMVPVETLKPGDVAEPAKAGWREGKPMAEVNLLDDAVELVFIEKSLVSEGGVHARVKYPYGYPCALFNVQDMIERTVEAWLSETSGD